MAPADVIEGVGELLPAGLYWLQPKSAVILEAEVAVEVSVPAADVVTAEVSELMPSSL